MTTGNVLYLVMAMGSFAAFSGMLAYQSWQQSRNRPQIVTAAAVHAEPEHAVTA